MSLTQKTFFGASIRSFSANIGWNNSSSSMTVRLVEDPDNGDSFQQPGMGTPAFFNYDGWEFNGIVQNWRQTGGNDGSPLYEITISDPREILAGVELILDGYNGTTSQVPNLINVYGYLESIQFGGSQRNESGMPWINVRSTAQTLTQTGTAYGGPIQFRGNVYAVDLTGLQLVPLTYRIGGTSITLLDFIAEMCAAASADFFVTLRVTNGVNVIVVNTISRRTQPTFGKINQFISNTTGAASKQVGFELRNEVTSKFVSGGQKQEMFIQFYNPINVNRGDDDTIWPYWGLTEKGDVIVGNGINDLHTFTLDSRFVDVPGVGDFYPTDVGEMRAAIDSQVAWESFISINSDNKFRLDEDGEETNVLNPHFKKRQALGIIGNTDLVLRAFLTGKTLQQLKALNPIDFLNIPNGDPTDNDQEETLNRMYRYVKEFADKYYGRQFMVRIPFVSARYDDNNQIITSREPIDGGYIAEADYPFAVGADILPEQHERLSFPDGRFQTYVRFKNAGNYDLAQLDPEDMIVDGSTVFVKCDIQPNLVYLNRNQAFSPRVVVELPAPVFRKDADFDGVIKNILLEFLTDKGSTDPAGDAKTIFRKFGADALSGANGGSAVLPDMAAVPLKSNIDAYGPWQAIGAQGKVEFEKDETLVPWNYGGYTAMNAVGQAKVTLALANQQVSENGSVEYPGIPTRQLGQTLIAGGPYVTNVDVNIADGGVTTTYRMNTWTPEFGTFAKQRAEQIQKLSRKAQEDRRNNRQRKNELLNAKASKFNRKGLNIINRKNSNSSHQLLAGDLSSSDGTGIAPNVVTLPTYNAIGKIIETSNKGAMSMDGMFRPFLNNAGGSGINNNSGGSGDLLSAYGGGNEGNPGIHANRLNPFRGDHDIQYIADNKPMALRGPVVITSWGFDTNGKPVPRASGDADDWITDYKLRSNQWKTGPLDVRWDDDLGKWSAIGGGGLERATIIDVSGESPLTGTLRLDSDGDKIVDYSNWLSIPICPGQKVFTTKIDSVYQIVNGEHTGLDVVTDITCNEETGITATKRTIYLGSAFGQEKICASGVE